LINTNQQEDYRPIETDLPDSRSSALSSDDLEDSEEIKNVKFTKALLMPGVLTFSLSFFFIKFAYYGIYYWVPTYLQDELGYSKDEAGNITSLGSVGGIIGCLLMGLLSDLLVVRSPVHLVGCAIAAVCLCLLSSVSDD
jgi:sugar phosphate permease